MKALIICKMIVVVLFTVGLVMFLIMNVFTTPAYVTSISEVNDALTDEKFWPAFWRGHLPGMMILGSLVGMHAIMFVERHVSKRSQSKQRG